VPLDFPAFTVEAEIGVGHSPRSPAMFGWDRPMNRDADFQIVFRKKSISFPASPNRPVQSYPFEYRFVLDTPFSLQPRRNAVIEVRISKSTLCNGASPVTVWFRGYNNGATGFRFGNSCSRWGVNAGNNLSLSRISAGNPGFADMAGVPATGYPNLSRYFGSLRRLDPPFRLDPLGAPGCSVYIPFDWEWQTYWGPWFPLAAIDVPNDPNVAGLTMYIQGIRLDRTANALGMDTSDGWAAPINPHVPARVSMLYGPAVSAPDSGHRRIGGPVFQLAGY
jgi:hypothetical protein